MFFSRRKVRLHVVSLLSLDSTEYTIGDEFSDTLEVRTSGSETVKVPTVFNVADLEPDDPNVSFGYAATEVWLGISESNERYFHVPLRLYGSDEIPWTEIELKPGMSIEIREKAKLKPFDPEEMFFDAPNSEVQLGVSLLEGRRPSTTMEAHTTNIQAMPFTLKMSTVVYNNKIILLPASGH